MGMGFTVCADVGVSTDDFNAFNAFNAASSKFAWRSTVSDVVIMIIIINVRLFIVGYADDSDAASLMTLSRLNGYVWVAECCLIVGCFT